MLLCCESQGSRDIMDVCGRVAVIFKILPAPVSFHSGACCAGRKHPTRRKKSANKTSTVRPSCGGWHQTGLPSASLCGPCAQPPEKPGFQLSGPPPPPVFQPLAFCGVEGFSPPPLSLIFLSFTWTMAPGKRNSWHPAFRLVLYLQQPNRMEKRTPHRLSPWVVRLFGILCVCFGGGGGRHPGFVESSRKLGRRKCFWPPASVFAKDGYPASRFVGNLPSNGF